MLTATEVADLCRCSRVTVYRWIREGWLRAHVVGGWTRVFRADFDAFLKATATLPDSDGPLDLLPHQHTRRKH